MGGAAASSSASACSISAGVKRRRSTAAGHAGALRPAAHGRRWRADRGATCLIGLCPRRPARSACSTCSTRVARAAGAARCARARSARSRSSSRSSTTTAGSLPVRRGSARDHLPSRLVAVVRGVDEHAVLVPRARLRARAARRQRTSQRANAANGPRAGSVLRARRSQSPSSASWRRSSTSTPAGGRARRAPQQRPVAARQLRERRLIARSHRGPARNASLTCTGSSRLTSLASLMAATYQRSRAHQPDAVAQRVGGPRGSIADMRGRQHEPLTAGRRTRRRSPSPARAARTRPRSRDPRARRARGRPARRGRRSGRRAGSASARRRSRPARHPGSAPPRAAATSARDGAGSQRRQVIDDQAAARVAGDRDRQPHVRERAPRTRAATVISACRRHPRASHPRPSRTRPAAAALAVELRRERVGDPRCRQLGRSRARGRRSVGRDRQVGAWRTRPRTPAPRRRATPAPASVTRAAGRPRSAIEDAGSGRAAARPRPRATARQRPSRDEQLAGCRRARRPPAGLRARVMAPASSPSPASRRPAARRRARPARRRRRR